MSLIIDNPQLEEEIQKIHFSNHGGTFIIGRYVIQAVYWSEDSKGNVLYDTESMEDEFKVVIDQFENDNENSEFDWDE